VREEGDFAIGSLRLRRCDPGALSEGCGCPSSGTVLLAQELRSVRTPGACSARGLLRNRGPLASLGRSPLRFAMQRVDYETWITRHEVSVPKIWEELRTPSINCRSGRSSVLLPVQYDVAYLRQAIESVRARLRQLGTLHADIARAQHVDVSCASYGARSGIKVVFRNACQSRCLQLCAGARHRQWTACSITDACGPRYGRGLLEINRHGDAQLIYSDEERSTARAGASAYFKPIFHANVPFAELLNPLRCTDREHSRRRRLATQLRRQLGPRLDHIQKARMVARATADMKFAASLS